MAFRSKTNVGTKDLSTIGSSAFQMASLSPAASQVPHTSAASYIGSGAVSGSAHYPTKKKFPARKVENGSIHGWLEAMKESSPPRVRCPRADAPQNLELDTVDAQYRAWMANHPSALVNFEKVLEAADGKRVFVFLDYDGTLSPIVEDPERAYVSEEMRTTVKEIAALFATAIITGRRRDKEVMVWILWDLQKALMGSRHMGNEVVLFQPASDFMLIMDEIFKLLEEKASKVPGAKVEHNKFCVSVHFRCVKEENWLPLAEQVNHVLKSYPNLYLTQGRKVLEIRPSISWNKGKALDFLIRTLGFGSRNDAFPIYIGDDKTDEDAFKVVARRKHGLAILVSDVVVDTNAVCSLRNPSP